MKNTEMLKKNYEFRNALSKGNYYTGNCIEAFIHKNKKQDRNLLGIAISVKIAKAVKRNNIKRLIRENYQFYENFLKKGYTIVFLWKKKVDTKNANFQNIKKDMRKIFDKANIIEETI